VIGNVELPQSILAPANATPAPPAASTSGSTSTSLPKDPKEKDKKKKYQLSGSAASDPLYTELRDMNFAHVGKKLSRVAKRLEGDYRLGVSCFRGFLNGFNYLFLRHLFF